MSDGSNAHFSYVDYAVFGLMLAISALIGLYYRFSGGKQKTMQEYMLADRQMSALPVAFSLMASFMSAITILGVSTENYSYGTQFMAINISYLISTPIVCYLYLPIFYRMANISVYQYLECRFGKVTRLLASIAFSLQMVLYMGIVLFAPALALSAVTGISVGVSIVVVGVVCTFYSSVGGMKAVLATDVFQSLLMFAAVFSVGFKGIHDYGWFNIFDNASASNRLEFFTLSVDPRVRHTFWSQAFGGIFTYCSLYGVNQAQVQRLVSVKSLKQARLSLWLQCVILWGISFSTCFAGLVMYSRYKDCDPLLSKKITNSDQLLPFYVVENLGHLPGVAGLFVSGIFSGSLSTVSSALNSLSAVTIEDYIVPYLHLSCLKSENLSLLGKILSLVYGVLCIFLAFLVQQLGSGILQASLTVFGAVGGPLLGLFTLGMIFSRVNQKGAVAGLLLGLTFTLWIGFGQPKPVPIKKEMGISNCSIPLPVAIQTMSNETLFEPSHLPLVDAQDEYNFLHELYAVSYMWVAPIGFILVIIIGNIVSLGTGGVQKPTDPKLLYGYSDENDFVKNAIPMSLEKAEATQL